MALRNTSERYEYIYGSNVRKLETDTAGKQTAKAVPAKKKIFLLFPIVNKRLWNRLISQWTP